MENMDGWRIGILVVVGYLAITSLVRMMIGRRNEMLERFRREMRSEQQQKRAVSDLKEVLDEQTPDVEQNEAA